MADKYLTWTQDAQLQRPDLATELQELGELYHKKLWHQLTTNLEGCIEQEAFQRDGFLIALYHNFIAGFAHKINLLKLAFFATAVGNLNEKPQDGLTFTQDVIANLEVGKLRDTEQPILYLKMQVAQYKLLLGDLAECKTMMEDGRKELQGMSDVSATTQHGQAYGSTEFVYLQHGTLKIKHCI